MDFVLRLKTNKNYYNTPKGLSLFPYIYDTDKYAPELVEALNSDLSVFDREEFNGVVLTEQEIAKKKVLRASSFPKFENTDSGMLGFWNSHPLSPDYVESDTDALAFGSLVHLLFQYKGNVPEGMVVVRDWSENPMLTAAKKANPDVREEDVFVIPHKHSRANSKKYLKAKKEVPEGVLLVSNYEWKQANIIYSKISEEKKKFLSTRDSIFTEEVIEAPFRIDNVLDSDWALSGHIDDLCINKELKEAEIIDYKTCDISQFNKWETKKGFVDALLNQFRIYSYLINKTYDIPLENITVIIFIILKDSNEALYSNSLQPIIIKFSDGEAELKYIESMIKNTIDYFDARLYGEPFTPKDIVLYAKKPIMSKTDTTLLTNYFEELKLDVAKANVDFKEGKDYFLDDGFGVITYDFYVRLLAKMGYKVNVYPIRHGDTFEYVLDGTKEKCIYLPNSDPESDISLYATNIIDLKTGEIVAKDRITPKKLDEYTSGLKGARKNFFWNKYFEQMAYKTCIKHSIRTFFLDHELFTRVENYEELVYNYWS